MKTTAGEISHDNEWLYVSDICEKNVIIGSFSDSSKCALYDTAELKSLSNGDMTLFQTLVEIFISMSDELLQQIDLQIELDNFSNIQKLIHKIKPSVITLKIKSIYDILSFIEQLDANTGITVEVKEKLTVFTNIIKEVRDDLKVLN